MSQNSTPILYQRRKKLKNSVAAIFNVQQCDSTKNSDTCTSVTFPEAPLLSPHEHLISVSECATEGVRTLNAFNVDGNCNCSSSKSNLELRKTPLQIDINEAVERSSSGVGRKKNYCPKSCKLYKHMNSTSNMLICDNCQNATDLDLESLEIMLKDTEPSMSNERIGNEFQADVPDWRGPVNEERDLTGDPLEANSHYHIDMKEHDFISIKPLKLDFIGNWLQCREVIGEGVHERICGKWRRAPLYEVQTDNWECFRCVLWDPARADCAVPQELDTDDIMKQLKYVEMVLRPRLAAKRSKLKSSKSNSSQ